ncbi:hypothetical protein H7J88_22440 [Mycolicibacterium flavescens]|uniref:Thioesterase n=1 Tax=Mycolicibacterium flavescens TaxID=1776 RepID=A0A1E3RDG7_MYCFV|nr:hypothetical protein [Mycolicibacterium flavescens]MCV7282395.1 hypothetical protein [Mycolicibacterium flavescens]ODQ87918.1 hypothetical protein BHQ18_21680 [Mycolicibacterium flavescens]
MTDAPATHQSRPDPQSDWAPTRGVLMSYAYLGSRPQAVDSTRAANELVLRDDLRTPVGAVLAAPLAIAMLDAATVNVESMRVHAVTQVDLDIVDCAIDTRRAYLAGRVTTEMRSQLFTEARIFDADDPSRHLGFGTANWSVLGHSPHRFCFPQPGPPDVSWVGRPPLWHAYSGRRRGEASMEIPRLPLEVGVEWLHHGPMLVITEAVALDCAAAALGSDELVVEHLAMTVVAPGRVGPFIATPVYSAIEGDSVGCRVELRDAGRGDRLIAATSVRMRQY